MQLATGQFAAIDEQTMSNDKLVLLAKVRDQETTLLVAGLDNPARKAHLMDYVR